MRGGENANVVNRAVPLNFITTYTVEKITKGEQCALSLHYHTIKKLYIKYLKCITLEQHIKMRDLVIMHKYKKKMGEVPIRQWIDAVREKNSHTHSRRWNKLQCGLPIRHAR